MKFNLMAHTGKITEYEGQFEVSDGGVLTIKPNSGGPIVSSPIGWLALHVTEADADVAG